MDKQKFNIPQGQLHDFQISSVVATKTRQLGERIVKLRNRNIEDALAEYFTHKYNTSVEDLKKVSGNVNNFKLKGFRQVTSPTETYYVDGTYTFLRVTCDGNIIHLWKEDNNV